MEITQSQKNKLKKILDLSNKGLPAILEYLFELEDKLETEIPQVKDIISRLKGDKGDNYVLTDKDKNVFVNTVLSLIDNEGIAKKVFDLIEIDYASIAKEASKLIEVPKAEKIDYKKIQKEVLAEIVLPEVKNGKDADEITIVDNVVSTMEKNLPQFGEAFRDGLELLQGDERLDKSAIKGLDDIIAKANEPKVSYTGLTGVKELIAGSNITIDNSNLQYPVISSTGGSGIVESVVAGININVDATDPANPIVNSLSDRYKTTSTTSQAIVSTGTLTFTVDANLAYTSQQDVIIAYDASNHMHGHVVSYSGTTLVVDITHKTGSGTYTSWDINLDGIATGDIGWTKSGTNVILSTITDNVGVGTATPVNKFHVESADNANAILFAGATKGVRIGLSSGGSLIEGVDSTGSGSYQSLDIGGSVLNFDISGVQKMVLNASGKLGVGTMSPNAILDVLNPAGSGVYASFGRNGTQGTFDFYNDGVGADYIRGSFGDLAFSTHASGPASISTEKMRITANGNVGIGVSSPSYRFTVDDNTASGIAGRFDQSSNSGSPFGIYAQASGASAQNVGGGFLASGATTNIGILSSVASGTNNYAIYSGNTARSYHAGSFGIGTEANGAYKLQVAGSTYSSGLGYTGAGGVAGVGTNPYATTNYIQSRSLNLITNGSGLLANNYNFTGFTFDAVETYSGGGSFRMNVANGQGYSDELIPVDPTAYYKLSAYGKSGDTGGGNYNPANGQYLGVSVYDIDGQLVVPQTFMKKSGSTDTTLAVALNPGDTTMTLTDATGWQNGSPDYEREFIWYGYTNAKGYTYPDYTYSRTYSSLYSGYAGIWNAGAISGNVITLAAPWTGPALAAGRAVRNISSGGTFKYIAASYANVPNTWTNYTGYIGGIDTNGTNADNLFPYGTAFVKTLFLINYHGAADNNIRWSNLTFEDIPNAVAPIVRQYDTTEILKNYISAVGDSYITGGKLGVGTSSPAYTLDVNGQGFFENGLRLGNTYSAIDVETGAAGLYLSGTQGAIDQVFIDPSGKVGMGITPTAGLHLKAGTATANTAPLKLTAGTVLTTPEAGVFEFSNSETGLTFSAVSTRRSIAYRNPIVSTITSSATPTPTAGEDHFTVTALAAGATFAAPTGSPTDGQILMIRIKDNGTARTLAFNAIYRAIGVTLPTTTVISKTMYLRCVYNSADTKWDVLATATEA